MVAWLVPPDVDPRQFRPAGTASSPVRRGLRALICAYGLFGFGYIVTATFLVAIVRASPLISATEPVVWLVVGLTAAPSVTLWARVASHLGISRTFSLACVVEAVGVAASVVWPTVPGVLFAAALLGGTFMGLTALGLAAARQFAPANPRPVLARMTAAFGLGQIVGPSMAGFLFDLTGGFGLPSLVAAGALIASAFIVRLVRL
jgi:MFS family permease